MHLLSCLALVLLHYIIYCRSDKPAAGYTLVNPELSTDNWAGASVEISAVEFTLCFWWKFNFTSRDRYQNIISVAIPGEFNWLAIAFDDTKNYVDVVWLNKVIVPEGNLNPRHDTWQFYCLVMLTTTDGVYWNFKFHTGSGWPSLSWVVALDELEKKSLFDSKFTTLSSFQTAFVIFNDQDSLFGGFDLYQAAIGAISCLNLWNTAYGVTELTSFASCNSFGDAYSMLQDTIITYGGVYSMYVPVPTVPPTTTSPITTTTTTTPLTTTTSTTPRTATTTTALSSGREVSQVKWSIFTIHIDSWMSGLVKYNLTSPTPLSCLEVWVSAGCSNVNFDKVHQTCEIGVGESSAELVISNGITHYMRSRD